MSKSEKKKLDYQYYKEHRICVHCRKNDAFAGYVLCPACIEKDHMRYHSFSEERKKEISRKGNEYNKQRKLKGLCIRCGKPVCERSKQYCNEHRLKHNAYKQEYRRKHKVYKTEEELAVIKAEKVRKLREGFRKWQETEQGKTNNANFKQRVLDEFKVTFKKRGVV